ncbi:MAG: hypothetical protein ACO1OB_10465 [Archangium sp.]
MKPHLPQLIAVFACLGVLAACNFRGPAVRQPPETPTLDAGQVRDAGFDPDAGIAPLEACALLNDARCDGLARCGLIAPDELAHAACVAAFEATWCGPTTWPTHVNAGALRLDSARALACVGALEAQACGSWPALPDPCTRFLLPRVPLGEPCFDGFDECLDGVCRGNACPRTCQPRAIEGEVCTNDDECRAGLSCRRGVVSPATVCSAPGNVGTACFADVDCAIGLACSEQQCKPLPAAGSKCLDYRCLDTAYCETDSTGGLCTARKSLGASCSGQQCAASLVCDPTSGTCVQKLASMHERCSPAQACPSGAVCVRVDADGIGTCALPAAEGEGCEADQDCERHLGCVFREADAGSTCERRGDAGTACASDQQCQVSAECQSASCAELPLPGESCAVTRSCRWGLCRDIAGSDGGAVCGALLSPGATCRSDAECASNSCKEGRCLARCVP